MGKAKIGLRTAALISVAAMTLAACGGGSGGSKGPSNSGSGGTKPVKGGTLSPSSRLADQIQHLDPQRNYTGEDLAFASAYLNRTLTSYKLSTNEAQANTLVPDLATDTGTASNGAKTWKFTLRDGAKFEDGTPVTCAGRQVRRVADLRDQTSSPAARSTRWPTWTSPRTTTARRSTKAPMPKGNDTAAFDKAVSCDDANKTITFHLANPVPDFNYTVTLSAFAPVPKAADTGEKYDDKPVSSGPYKISEYTKGSQLVLVRNENWDPSDPYRPAYPDKIVVKFGLDPSVIDQRLIQDSGPTSRRPPSVTRSRRRTSRPSSRTTGSRTAGSTSSTRTRTTTRSTRSSCRTSSTGRPSRSPSTGRRSGPSMAAASAETLRRRDQAEPS